MQEEHLLLPGRNKGECFTFTFTFTGPKHQLAPLLYVPVLQRSSPFSLPSASRCLRVGVTITCACLEAAEALQHCAGPPQVCRQLHLAALLLPVHLQEFVFAFVTAALPFISAKDLRLHALPVQSIPCTCQTHQSGHFGHGRVTVKRQRTGFSAAI